MYRFISKNLENKKFLLIFFSILLIFFLLTLAYKNNNSIKNINTKNYQLSLGNELILIKKYFLNQIKSPFININHEIKSGDTIGKILKKYNIKNNEIQKIIDQYQKYGKSNQLAVGNVINLVIDKSLSKEKYSITNFFIPITKSTSIEMKKNELGAIESKKIITQLYKKTVVAENIIENNLYSSAINSKINPDTIIEFARIFGFEIDFQRDIRKNDYFKIVYDKFFDENGEFIKS